MFGSSSVFLCLGVCLVICGICLYLISIKFDEQNEKIKNMFDLIYTVTNELQLLKLQQQPSLQPLPNTTTTSTNTLSDFADIDIGESGGGCGISNSPLNKCIVLDTLIPTYDANLINSTNGKLLGSIKKIVVSDCDDSSSDDDSDADEDVDDTEDDDEDLDGSDDSDEEEEEDEPAELCVFELNDLEHTINSTDTPSNSHVVDNDLIQIHSEEEDDGDEVIKSISIHSDDIDDSVSSSDQNTDTGYTTTTIVEPNSPVSDTQINTKTIVVDLDPTQPDYKKMSIHQLRKIAIEKGLIVGDSKLKKNDILKLVSY